MTFQEMCRVVEAAPTVVLRKELDRRECGAVNPELAEFVKWVAAELGYSRGHLLAAGREQPRAGRRQVAMVAARRVGEPWGTLCGVARAFGRREHGTVLWAEKVVGADPELAAEANRLAAMWREEQAAAAVVQAEVEGAL